MKEQKITLTDAQLNEASGDLDMGMKIYYNLKTGEINSVPDLEEFGAFDDGEGLWEDSIKEIESNPDNYAELEKMSSRQSFRMMENFAATVADDNLKSKLFNSLDRKSPFQNFKLEVDNNEHYRQLWFKFKDEESVKFVKEQIEELNQDNDQD